MILLKFTLLHSVTVSELLFLRGLAAVFEGLLISSQLTAHPLALCTTHCSTHCAPISRLRNSYSSFDLEPLGFLRVTKKLEEAL
jgi:hypothetical protein